MTSPPEEISVKCPGCGKLYQDWRRPSINRTLGEKFDVVLLTSKAYDSRWLTEFIKPHLADDGLLVAVQNCMTAEMIADIVGPERTVGCVVELSSQLFDPAEIRRNTDTSRTWFGLGAFDPAHADRIEDAAEILRHAGTVDITDDILSAKWMKLIVNAMTMGLKAILGANNEQVFKLPGARELFLRAGEEALAAGQLLGYKVVPIFGLKPEDVENTNNLLETLLEKITRDVGPAALNTVLQDHMKGRYSEIDLINGLIRRRERQERQADAGQRRAGRSEPAHPCRRTGTRPGQYGYDPPGVGRLKAGPPRRLNLEAVEDPAEAPAVVQHVFIDARLVEWVAVQ